jgi:hypothetical protein
MRTDKPPVTKQVKINSINRSSHEFPDYQEAWLLLIVVFVLEL